MIKKNGKKIITVLLLLSCIVSGFILAASPEVKSYRMENTRQLDSLLNIHFQEALIMPGQIRTTVIRNDSILARKIFRVRVPSRFSKTLFHFDLHKDLHRYDIEVPARVQLPNRDMDIYVYSQNTVLRTIRLTTDTDLDTLNLNE